METSKLYFEKLCNSRGINLAKPGERHYRGGDWCSLRCPFCSGQEGNHLGFNRKTNVFTCFRCGRHGKYETLSALLGVSKKEAYEIAQGFSMDRSFERQTDVRIEVEHVEEEDFVLPGKPKLLRLQKEYLEGRKYDAEGVYRTWKLRSTGNCGQYAYRIVIPITYRGQVVSFTTRDVTGEAKDRYLACPPKEAIRHHKHCVYGLDQSPYKKTCVTVEGTFGVWRVGLGANCTLGTGWTSEQAKLIANRFRKSYVFFDPEEKEATRRAESLAEMLSSYRCHTSYFIEGKGAKGRDTGELSRQEIADVRKLLK